MWSVIVFHQTLIGVDGKEGGGVYFATGSHASVNKGTLKKQSHAQSKTSEHKHTHKMDDDDNFDLESYIEIAVSPPHPAKHGDGLDVDVSKDISPLEAVGVLEALDDTQMIEMFSTHGYGVNNSGQVFPLDGEGVDWQQGDGLVAKQLVDGRMCLSDLARDSSVGGNTSDHEKGTMTVSMRHKCRMCVDDVMRENFVKKKSGTGFSVRLPLGKTDTFGKIGFVINDASIELESMTSELFTGYSEADKVDGAQYEKSNMTIVKVVERDTDFTGFIKNRECTMGKFKQYDFHSRSVPTPISLAVRRRVDMDDLHEKGPEPVLPSTLKTPLLWCMLKYDVNDPNGRGELVPHNNELAVEPSNGRVGSLGGFVDISFVDNDLKRIDLPFNLYSFNDRHAEMKAFTFKVRVGANVDPAVYRPVFFSLQAAGKDNKYRLRPVAAMDAILVIPQNPRRKRALNLLTKWNQFLDMQMKMKTPSMPLTYDSATHFGSASTQRQDDDGGQANMLPSPEARRSPVDIPSKRTKRQKEPLENRMEEMKHTLARCFAKMEVLLANI